MRAIVTSLCVLSAAACSFFKPLESMSYVGRLPPGVHVDLTGTFTLSWEDELSLALTDPCVMGRWPMVPCDRVHLDMVPVVAATPWHSEIPGEWIDASHLVFRIDWKNSGLDPLADDAITAIMKPWVISGTSWTPDAIEARRILLLVREATGIRPEPAGIQPDTALADTALADTALADTTLPDTALAATSPRLEVTRFEIVDGALRAGDASTLRVQIANRGQGIAYDVIATTRSGIKRLHGRQLRFGDVLPSTEELRHLGLTVPASETSPDTMLVLIFKERYGFSPPNISRRFRIDAAKIAPVLAVHCSIPGRSASQPDLDAGEDVLLRCLVGNSGSGAAMVEIVTSLAGAAPVQLPARSVAPRSQASFEVPIRVPRQLAIDSAVEITVIARDRQFAREARTTLVGVIRKPKLCVAGELTHAQYDAKLAKLRKAKDAGELTQEQFDRYDAELVTCLN